MRRGTQQAFSWQSYWSRLESPRRTSPKTRQKQGKKLTEATAVYHEDDHGFGSRGSQGAARELQVRRRDSERAQGSLGDTARVMAAAR